MGALIPIFLQYLPSLIKAAQSVPEIIGFIKRTQDTLRQSKEWTAAEQAQFDKDVESVMSKPHWQTDK